jgi:hypothetical protein
MSFSYKTNFTSNRKIMTNEEKWFEVFTVETMSALLFPGILDYDASSVLMWAVWTGLAVLLPVLCPLHLCFEPQF